MRYFLNTSAGRPVVAAGQTFEFELVGLRGGSWLGILALEEPGASILAAARAVNTDEISEEIYLIQKKKSSANPPNSPAWPRQSATNPALAIADRAGSPTSPGDFDRAPNPATAPGGGPNSTSGVSAVSLMTTTHAPPDEPLLAQPIGKRRGF